MLFNSPNVLYLENSEFDTSLNLVSPLVNKYSQKPIFSGLTIVMIQGNYCGYCTQMKPLFQQVANELVSSGIDFATIQVDGQQPGEQIFSDPTFFNRLMGHSLQGVPLLVKFINGKYVPNSEFTGNRDIQSLKQWILNL